MQRMLDAARVDADKRIFAWILVMRYAGLRISDACMLHTNAVKGNQITLRAIKTDVEISVAVPPIVIQELQRITPKRNGHFFWNGNSTLASLTDLYRDFHLRRVFERAGVKGTPHMFRHTFVQRALDSGLMSMRQVAAAIGDSELICQRHYGKWNKRGQEQLNAQLQAVHSQDKLLQTLNQQGRKTSKSAQSIKSES